MRLIRYRFGDFELDPASRELSRSGQRLALPLKSLECLAYLLANRERAVGRDELVSAVWGRADVSDTVITQTMRRARKALDDAGDRQAFVRTVPGFGYRWVAPVEEIGAATSTDPAATTPATTRAPSPLPDVIAEATAHEVPAPPIDTPASAVARRGTGRWLIVLAAAVLLAVLAVLGWRYFARPTSQADARTAPAADRVTVLPVTVTPAGAEFSWVRLGAMEYAADRLRAAALKVTPTEQTLHLSAALEAGTDKAASTVQASEAPTDAQLLDVLARSGAHWLVVPHAQRNGEHWRVQLRALDGTSDVRVEAQGDTPLQAMAVATDAWLHRVDRAAPRLAGPTPLQERLQRIDAELDVGQLEAAREQIVAAPSEVRNKPEMQVREGQLEYRAGRIDAAQALFERVLAQPGPVDRAVRAKGLMGLGAVALRQGHPAGAEQRYSQALEALSSAPPQDSELVLLGNAYNGRGVARVQQQDLEGAVADLGLARVAMRQSGDVVSAAMVGSNLGRIEAIRNHWPQAAQEYDSAIEVFEHYQIHDYLAAMLSAKALAQLEMVQPMQAQATIARVQPLAGQIEDPTLTGVVANAQVRVALANGELQRAETALQRWPVTAGQHDPPEVTALRMGVALARGEHARAARLATRAPPATPPVAFTLAAIAVQAADSAEVAHAWFRPSPRKPAPSPAPQASPAEGANERAFAMAVLARRFGQRSDALAAATEAVAIADRDGSANDRVRANVLRAQVLLDAGRLQDATAVLGELDAYADVDYRVAWLAWKVYERRGDADLARHGFLQAQALRGQRELAGEPLL
ncbi:hypothetical protein ARC20_17530 [Stenotrophomonas panacihumi]|uniref:OmpR/PhoB-type domain-containing protein n=1 Tax=Stenotrophomonas panacihumi TaxID=676599 RepID=A0A0R0B1S7_9GAMM|nr:transcriptional regulator [Stenotrophomonas panacihumi]KRG47998.1 hypothetical protein ARC20_17530 [Stenotrophomonas panacihumi]PTN56153.1 transcriptional regulator [Stenotrophomonas panacihumi]